jgi:hypothetical protein
MPYGQYDNLPLPRSGYILAEYIDNCHTGNGIMGKFTIIAQQLGSGRILDNNYLLEFFDGIT